MEESPTPMDITNHPELIRLANEVRTTGRARILRQDSEELAVVLPKGPSSPGGKRPDSADLDDSWDGYDPEKVRAAVTKTAGALSPEDADAMLAELYRARDEGSRPATRP